MFNSNSHVAIVIHKTGGDATPADVYRTFINSGNPGKSSHYVIGQDGSIWQFVPEALGAGANGVTDGTTEPFWHPYMTEYSNLNMCTISIEHCDPSARNDTPLTGAQKQASFALVAHLCQKYGIAADHIKGHNTICATDCPGNYPMGELIAYIQGGAMLQITDPLVGDYFEEQDANHWRCKHNGHIVRDGNLNFYRNLRSGQTPELAGLTMLGLPTGDEKPIDGDGNTEQPFERAKVRYDPAHKYDNPPGAGSSYTTHVDAPAPTPTPAPPTNTDAIAQLHTIQTAASAALKDLGAAS